MSETIDVKINISDISQQLSDARQELTSLKNEIEATPSIHQVMGEGLDKT